MNLELNMPHNFVYKKGFSSPQALQSLPLHKKFYACRKHKEKLRQTSNQNQRALPKTECIRMFNLTENQFSSCILFQENIDLQECHVGAKDLVIL